MRTPTGPTAQARALRLIAGGAVRCANPETQMYFVRAPLEGHPRSANDFVVHLGAPSRCSCPTFKSQSGRICEHIAAGYWFAQMKRLISPAPVLEELQLEEVAA
jgi:hypothetical protein